MSFICARCVVTGLAAFGLLNSAPAYPLDGDVYDGATGKPLEGVYVIGTWDVYPPFAHDACIKVDVVRTDANGRFSLPSWSGHLYSYLFSRETLGVYFYKRAYRWERGFAVANERVIMVPDARRLELRVADWIRSSENAECGDEADWAPKLLPIYREMYAESRPMVVTDEEKASSRLARDRIEYLKLGRDEAQRRKTKRGADTILLCGVDRKKCNEDPDDY